MEKRGYKIASILFLLAGMWSLDIQANGLRLIAGIALVAASIGFWGSAAKPS